MTDDALLSTCVVVIPPQHGSGVWKIEPWNSESWNVYHWTEGWSFYDNVPRDIAQEYLSDAVEIFREISLPQHG